MHVKPPERIKRQKRLFLAGSIEQGTAELWQDVIAQELHGKDVVVVNPRRDDWNPDWVQSLDNEDFVIQLDWEISELDAASYVAFYFQAGTKSPISIGEFYYLLPRVAMGLVNVAVCCPEGFWRKGNIDFMAERFRVHQCYDLDALTTWAVDSVS